MTTEIIITGTGNPAPEPDRAGPGVLIRYTAPEAEGATTLQFDAGRGTVMRLSAAGVDTPELTAFFATHHHSDHLTGLPDLLMTRWVMDRTDRVAPLPIVVPAGPCESFINTMLDPWQDDLDVRREHTGRPTTPTFELVAFPCPGPDKPVEVWSQGEIRVLAGVVRHEPVTPAVGYRIETPDGVVAITGDTLVCEEVSTLAAGADVLIYEAMLFEVIQAAASFRHFILDYHADSRLIGRQAAELGVPHLLLTHLIPPPRGEDDKQTYVDNIRAGGYEGRLLVCDDLDSVVLG